MPNPTYSDLGDHTECVQVDFDPAQVSYGLLLELFWNTPNLCDQDDTLQYRSAIFTHNERQQQMAVASRPRRDASVTTAIVPISGFYVAESFHQKFKLRQEPELLRELEGVYPNDKDLVNSTAAARINAYLGGCGSDGQFEREVVDFGLSEQGEAVLRELWRHRPKLQ